MNPGGRLLPDHGNHRELAALLAPPLLERLGDSRWNCSSGDHKGLGRLASSSSTTTRTGLAMTAILGHRALAGRDRGGPLGQEEDCHAGTLAGSGCGWLAGRAAACQIRAASRTIAAANGSM